MPSSTGFSLLSTPAVAARPTLVSSDGKAMHEATAAIGAEGTVSKAVRSVYRAGRSRYWLKAKHSTTETFQVAGWRPSTPSRPGGLILAEHDDPIAVATLAIADKDRQHLDDLLHRWGRRHPTGAVTIPPDLTLHDRPRYTSRTPTHGKPPRGVRDGRPTGRPSDRACLASAARKGEPVARCDPWLTNLNRPEDRSDHRLRPGVHREEHSGTDLHLAVYEALADEPERHSRLSRDDYLTTGRWHGPRGGSCAEGQSQGCYLLDAHRDARPYPCSQGEWRCDGLRDPAEGHRGGSR